MRPKLIVLGISAQHLRLEVNKHREFFNFNQFYKSMSVQVILVFVTTPRNRKFRNFFLHFHHRSTLHETPITNSKCSQKFFINTVHARVEKHHLIVWHEIRINLTLYISIATTKKVAMKYNSGHQLPVNV